MKFKINYLYALTRNYSLYFYNSYAYIKYNIIDIFYIVMPQTIIWNLKILFTAYGNEHYYLNINIIKTCINLKRLIQ